MVILFNVILFHCFCYEILGLSHTWFCLLQVLEYGDNQKLQPYRVLWLLWRKLALLWLKLTWIDSAGSWKKRRRESWERHKRHYKKICFYPRHILTLPRAMSWVTEITHGLPTDTRAMGICLVCNFYPRKSRGQITHGICMANSHGISMDIFIS